MTAYCMAFSKCCRKLAKWGSGYVLISYPRIRKKCIQERIQSLLTTDYIQTTTDTELYFEYFLLTYRLQQLQWLSSRSCWAKNIFPKPHIKLIRGLYVFSIQICIFCIVFLYYSVFWIFFPLQLQQLKWLSNRSNYLLDTKSMWAVQPKISFLNPVLNWHGVYCK